MISYRWTTLNSVITYIYWTLDIKDKTSYQQFGLMIMSKYLHKYAESFGFKLYPYG
jgi:hypothetical protein